MTDFISLLLLAAGSLCGLFAFPKAIDKLIFFVKRIPFGRNDGSVTLVNSSGYQHGIASGETGIEISKFVCTIAPEWKKYRMSRTNEKIGFAIAPPELKISLEGEIGATTGLMALNFSTAATIANAVSYFGSPSTGIYLDTAEVTQERDGWKGLSQELSSNAGIA